MPKAVFVTLFSITSVILFALSINSASDVERNLEQKGIEKETINEVIAIYNQLSEEAQGKVASILEHPYVKQNFIDRFVQNYGLETGSNDAKALSALIDTEGSLLTQLWVNLSKEPTQKPQKISTPNPLYDWHNTFIQARGRAEEE